MYDRDIQNQEKYFGRSYSHAFALWKLRQVMLGKTASLILREMPLDDQPRRRILDLGCGPGINLFALQDYCFDLPDVDWYGLDMNSREITYASARSRYRKVARSLAEMRFSVGDVFHLPFMAEVFDLILCSEVVEHLEDPKSALVEIARITRPGGFVMFTTPNPRNLPEQIGYLMDAMSNGRFKRNYWAGHDDITAPPLSAEVGLGHVSVHPFSVWRNWLTDTGFQVIRKVRGPMTWGGPFFDRHRFLSGLLIMLDPVLDLLPGRFLTSANLGILCRKLGCSKSLKHNLPSCIAFNKEPL